MYKTSFVSSSGLYNLLMMFSWIQSDLSYLLTRPYNISHTNNAYLRRSTLPVTLLIWQLASIIGIGVAAAC